MDILDLDAGLKHLAHNGFCFNVEEKFQLEMGLQKLLNDASPDDFEELLFWGRVSGVQRDYYIAMGVTYSGKYEFPEKRFYYATSANFEFKAFPELNTQHEDAFDKLEGFFTGNPDKIHVQVEAENKEEEEKPKEEEKEKDPLEDTEEEDPNKDFVARNLIEADRLYYHVRAIENDCNIVPHGSFRLTEQHEVTRNCAFRGLDAEKAFDLNSYMHFRNVQSEHKLKALLEDDAVFSLDFLDDALSDKPEGVWSIQKDSNGTTAIIRNHCWAGYTAFHTTCKTAFGGVYIGDGLKIADVALQM